MSGASVEDTLELWAATLRATKARIRPLFAHPSVADSAAAFLDGLLGPERRKTGWMRAEAAGDPGPWRQQAVLGRSRWQADALRDLVRDDVLETLAEPQAVLVIDETGFLKQGKASCGVVRQYTGSAGKITNCQVGVFAAYVSSKGHAFIDRALYLPRSWTSAPERRRATHVPETVSFATKPQLAVQMIVRAITTQVPFAWATGDTIYGVSEVEMALRRAGKAPVGGGGRQGRAALRLGLSGTGRPGGGRIQREPVGAVDARASDPAQPHGWQARLLLDLVPSRHANRGAGGCRGAALGD
jgi:SRSO17 transposase